MMPMRKESLMRLEHKKGNEKTQRQSDERRERENDYEVLVRQAHRAMVPSMMCSTFSV